ncbi:MAG: hypothetical protein LWW90_06455 [Candidatus Desulfofervidus auxilii]|nr:hypothetical protein [Candidatus Desulfofervidus auxilii]
MEDTRKVRLKLLTPLLGSLPDKKIFTKMMEKKGEIIDQEDLEEHYDELSMLPEETKYTVFPRDVDGVYIMDYQVKGFFKNAGNVLKDILKIKALRKKVDNYLFITPRFIYLTEKVSGILERPLRAQTPKGERITVVASEYIAEGLEFEFEITLLNHKELTWKVVEKLLDYGKYKGLLQWRNGGYGRFKWQWVK